MFSQDDLKKTRFFQDVMEEGALKTGREYILLVLEVRFTNVPSDTGEILNTINDSSFLDSLIRQAATVDINIIILFTLFVVYISSFFICSHVSSTLHVEFIYTSHTKNLTN